LTQQSILRGDASISIIKIRHFHNKLHPTALYCNIALLTSFFESGSLKHQAVARFNSPKIKDHLKKYTERKA